MCVWGGGGYATIIMDVQSLVYVVKVITLICYYVKIEICFLMTITTYQQASARRAAQQWVHDTMAGNLSDALLIPH